MINIDNIDYFLLNLESQLGWTCALLALTWEIVWKFDPLKRGSNCEIAEKVIFLDLLPSELSKTVINLIWPKYGLVHFCALHLFICFNADYWPKNETLFYDWLNEFLTSPQGRRFAKDVVFNTDASGDRIVVSICSNWGDTAINLEVVLINMSWH